MVTPVCVLLTNSRFDGGSYGTNVGSAAVKISWLVVSPAISVMLLVTNTTLEPSADMDALLIVYAPPFCPMPMPLLLREASAVRFSVMSRTQTCGPVRFWVSQGKPEL